MTRGSLSSAVRARQSLDATRNAEAATRYAELRVALAAKFERIRSLMVNAPPGFQSRVADLMEARKERISRELQGVEKLSVAVFLAEVALHRAEGRPEMADRLMEALNAGERLRIHAERALLIRLSDGQMFLDLDPVKA